MPKKSSTPIVYRKLSDLVKLAHNPRTIKKEDMERLMASISKFGVLEGRPFLLSNRTGELVIIGGNMRYEACKKLKIEEVPTHLIEGLTEEEEKEIIIRDNVSNGEWDMEMLANEWGDEPLAEWGVDVSFETVEPEAEEDDFEVDEGIKTDIVIGDLFEIGPHRLLCGDSTNIDHVEKLMNGDKADMVFTDPPYNTGMGEKNAGSTWLNHMFDDNYTDEEWEQFMSDFVSMYSVQMKDNTVCYMCLDWRRNHELIPHIKKHFHLSNVIVWDKMVHGLGSDYKYTYELINVCKKGKPVMDTHQGDDREYSDVWHIQRKMGKDEDHATKKPIEIVERALRHASKKDNVVLDLFGGSGSTMVACHQLNRKCYMSELDPKYVQTIINRMIKLEPSIEVKRNGKPYVNTSE